MLAHSGDPVATGSAVTYGDKSGMMGFSYNNDDGPKQCFNAPKNWQLGWYHDKQILVSFDGWEGNLIGLSDYGNPNVAAEDIIIAKVDLTESYYVSFNRKTGINSGTVEGGDQVMVHTRNLGMGYGESDVLACLNSGDSYTSPDSYFVVTVNIIDLNSNPARANVKVQRFDPPPPCYTGTVSVFINPDPYPGETSWNIIDDAENVLVSGGSTGASNVVLEDGYYTFSIHDSHGDGICCAYGNGSYSLEVGSSFNVTGGEFGSQESTQFGICNNVSPSAAPMNTPTISPTSSSTATVSIFIFHSLFLVGKIEFIFILKLTFNKFHNTIAYKVGNTPIEVVAGSQFKCVLLIFGDVYIVSLLVLCNLEKHQRINQIRMMMLMIVFI